MNRFDIDRTAPLFFLWQDNGDDAARAIFWTLTEPDFPPLLSPDRSKAPQLWILLLAAQNHKFKHQIQTEKKPNKGNMHNKWSNIVLGRATLSFLIGKAKTAACICKTLIFFFFDYFFGFGEFVKRNWHYIWKDEYHQKEEDPLPRSLVRLNLCLQCITSWGPKIQQIHQNFSLSSPFCFECNWILST